MPIADGLVALWRIRDDEPVAPDAPPELVPVLALTTQPTHPVQPLAA